MARGLLGGTGRADLTPPPGAGLFGFGPEGRRARGHRQRLYARALVLEDEAGERLALVVVDLGAVSTLLHREVAARIVEETGIGADRLVLAASHTHTGPGHFLSAREYNASSSSVGGYDSRLAGFLVERIAGAVLEAFRGRRSARAAWGQAAVWGHTWNRSLEAYRRNPDPPLPGFALPPGLEPERAAVDPAWTMLRVDLLDPASRAYRPAGAFSVFAVHPTSNPGAFDLYDADLHGVVNRAVERHLDRLAGRAPEYVPRAVHLFANGAEGDVSPRGNEPSRPCHPPVLRRARRPGGPRTPPGAEEWRPAPGREPGPCLEASRANLEDVGDSLAARAVALFDSLEPRLSGGLRLARAFRALPLRGPEAPAELCDPPRVGAPTPGGTPDARTRIHGWSLLGIPATRFREGPSGGTPGEGDCHAPKRIALGSFQGLRTGEHGLPDVAQLTVFRLGDRTVATVPGEPTTRVGARIREAVAGSLAGGGGGGAGDVAVVGLANGYLHYITTPEEYAVQRYEGGSTLYGPASAPVLARELARLAATLGPPGSPSPPAAVAPVTAHPGPDRRVAPFPPPGTSSPPPPRVLGPAACAGDTAVARWLDAPPGRLVPADGPLVAVEARRAGGWARIAWDDDPSVEVRSAGESADGPHAWEVRWIPRPAVAHPPEGAREEIRFVLLPRDGLEGLVGDPFPACPAPAASP